MSAILFVRAQSTSCQSFFFIIFSALHSILVFCTQFHFFALNFTSLHWSDFCCRSHYISFVFHTVRPQWIFFHRCYVNVHVRLRNILVMDGRIKSKKLCISRVLYNSVKHKPDAWWQVMYNFSFWFFYFQK